MISLNRRDLISAGALTGLVAACQTHTASVGVAARRDYDRFIIDLDRQPDLVVDIWPDGPPGPGGENLNPHYISRENPFGLPDRAVHEVTRPKLSLFRAAVPNGTSILIIPGGGYNHVVVEKEGYEGARYFSTFGFDVWVMDYRLPHQGWAAGPDAPFQDAQRAVRTLRQLSRTSRNKLVVMGFSAGGHLAGSLSQKFQAELYEPVDQADTLSARPDLSALIYPVALMGTPFTHMGSQERLLGSDPTPEMLAAYDLTTHPNPDGPPVFLLHALDDEAVPYENALRLATSYRNAGIPAVLHSFETGGHGFGMRGIDKTPLAKWPGLFMDWSNTDRPVES